MMQDRWPPEPPRYDPPKQKRTHAGWLVLAALLVVLLTFMLIFAAQQSLPQG